MSIYRNSDRNKLQKLQWDESLGPKPKGWKPGKEIVPVVKPDLSRPQSPGGLPELEPLPPGSPKVPLLSDQERFSVLNNLRAGAGRALSCEQVGVKTRQLYATMEADELFADEVREVESAALDDVRLGIHQAATSGENPGLALAWVKTRNDEANARELLRQNERKLNIEQQVADGHTGSASINLTNLDDAEFDRFRTLHTKIEAGEDIGPSEAIEYCRLMHKMGHRRGPDTEGVTGRPLRAALPLDGSIQEAERLFGVDDNEGG